MNDEQFLLWIRDRLVNVYKESPNTDFVLRLEEIAGRQPLDVVSLPKRKPKM